MTIDVTETWAKQFIGQIRVNICCDQQTAEYVSSGETAVGGGCVTVCGCFSYRSQQGMHILQGKINEHTYRNVVLRNSVVPNCDNHPLASRPLNIDDNSRPQMPRILTDYIMQEAIDKIFWSSMSQHMNPMIIIEQV